MKIFVVSDTHGYVDGFLDGIQDMARPDLIIHLGDYVRDGIQIADETGIRTKIVKGNGDYFERGYNEDEVFRLQGRTFLITHGHKHRVRYGIDNLYYYAREVGADIVLFGHTHVPLIMEESKMLIMNPGSPYLPRGLDRSKTFGIIEIGEDISGKILTI
ncbi:MAG: metallophosphoesterase [Tissierellia bacterium]|nr:metallophosphoesterase [Tissierellia bacterium]